MVQNFLDGLSVTQIFQILVFGSDGQTQDRMDRRKIRLLPCQLSPPSRIYLDDHRYRKKSNKPINYRKTSFRPGN